MYFNCPSCFGSSHGQTSKYCVLLAWMCKPVCLDVSFWHAYMYFRRSVYLSGWMCTCGIWSTSVYLRPVLLYLRCTWDLFFEMYLRCTWDKCFFTWDVLETCFSVMYVRGTWDKCFFTWDVLETCVLRCAWDVLEMNFRLGFWHVLEMYLGSCILHMNFILIVSTGVACDVASFVQNQWDTRFTSRNISSRITQDNENMNKYQVATCTNTFFHKYKTLFSTLAQNKSSIKYWNKFQKYIYIYISPILYKCNKYQRGSMWNIVISSTGATKISKYHIFLRKFGLLCHGWNGYTKGALLQFEKRSHQMGTPAKS